MLKEKRNLLLFFTISQNEIVSAKLTRLNLLNCIFYLGNLLLIHIFIFIYSPIANITSITIFLLIYGIPTRKPHSIFWIRWFISSWEKNNGYLKLSKMTLKIAVDAQSHFVNLLSLTYQLFFSQLEIYHMMQKPTANKMKQM